MYIYIHTHTHIYACLQNKKSIEHPAIEKYLQNLQRNGTIELTTVPVNTEGIVSAADVASAMQPNTVLVTIMHSNNEVGSIQPIKSIAEQCKRRASQMSPCGHVLVHTDAAQSIGKVDIDVQDLGLFFDFFHPYYP
jgi:cysteine desulfurase